MERCQPRPTSPFRRLGDATVPDWRARVAHAGCGRASNPRAVHVAPAYAAENTRCSPRFGTTGDRSATAGPSGTAPARRALRGEVRLLPGRGPSVRVPPTSAVWLPLKGPSWGAEDSGEGAARRWRTCCRSMACARPARTRGGSEPSAGTGSALVRSRSFPPSRTIFDQTVVKVPSGFGEMRDRQLAASTASARA